MHPIVILLIVVTIALIGYFFPKRYNDYFYSEYHENAVCMPLAIATAVFSSLWLVFMDLDGFWYWFLLIASIVLCVVSILRTVYVGISVSAGAFEIVIAIIAQIFATAGVIILILGTLLLIMELFGGKKRKRK